MGKKDKYPHPSLRPLPPEEQNKAKPLTSKQVLKALDKGRRLVAAARRLMRKRRDRHEP